MPNEVVDSENLSPESGHRFGTRIGQRICSLNQAGAKDVQQRSTINHRITISQSSPNSAFPALLHSKKLPHARQVPPTDRNLALNITGHDDDKLLIVAHDRSRVSDVDDVTAVYTLELLWWQT